MGPNGAVVVSVDVENTGRLSGEEVVQLYLHRPVASVTRPVKELKGFRKVMPSPGEKKTVTFLLSQNELGFLDAAMNFVVEPGIVEVLVGSSSEDVRAKGTIKLEKP